jgi:hypothetical protein
MNALRHSLITATALSLGLLAGTASAGETCDPKDPKCEPPKVGDCSPGFYKNHLTYWVGIYCNDSVFPTCSTLLTALTCKGSDASCGRSAAAAYLNNRSGCTETSE